MTRRNLFRTLLGAMVGPWLPKPKRRGRYIGKGREFVAVGPPGVTTINIVPGVIARRPRTRFPMLYLVNRRA